MHFIGMEIAVAVANVGRNNDAFSIYLVVFPISWRIKRFLTDKELTAIPVEDAQTISFPVFLLSLIKTIIKFDRFKLFHNE